MRGWHRLGCLALGLGITVLLSACGADICAMGFGQCEKMARDPNKPVSPSGPPAGGGRPPSPAPLTLHAPVQATESTQFSVITTGGTPPFVFAFDPPDETRAMFTEVGAKSATIQVSGNSGKLRIKVTDAKSKESLREVELTPFD